MDQALLQHLHTTAIAVSDRIDLFGVPPPEEADAHTPGFWTTAAPLVSAEMVPLCESIAKALTPVDKGPDRDNGLPDPLDGLEAYLSELDGLLKPLPLRQYAETPLLPVTTPEEETAAALDEVPPPTSARDRSVKILFEVDGQPLQLMASEGFSKGPDAKTFVRNLVSYFRYDGHALIHHFYGRKGADLLSHSLYPVFPPEKGQYAPGYWLFVDILSKRDTRSWTWHVRRHDHAVVLNRLAADGSSDRKVVFPNCVQALNQFFCAIATGNWDVERTLGGFFASMGIPYVNNDRSTLPTGGPEEGLSPGAAAAEEAYLRGALPLIAGVDYPTAKRRCLLLNEQRQAKEPVINDDKAPGQMRALARKLNLHPVRALALSKVLRSSPDRALLLADALEKNIHGPGNRLDRDTITFRKARPTMEAVREALGEDRSAKFYEEHLDHQIEKWRRYHAKVGPKRSNTLVRRALMALSIKDRVDELAPNPENTEDFFRSKTGGCEDAEEAFRRAIRPWEGTWRCVEVGSTQFGKMWKNRGPLPPRRTHATPVDFYRLMYLCKPVGVDFDDLYGAGLFGIRSPCGRFGVSFAFWKYTLSGRFYVAKDFAVRTREERGPLIITSGIPGSDNGVGTTHPDALRFFRMVTKALRTPWAMYPGNGVVV